MHEFLLAILPTVGAILGGVVGYYMGQADSKQ